VFIFWPLNCFSAFEIIINFVEARLVQVLPVDWWIRNVWSANSFSPYDDNQSFSYHSFKRWVAPPPNPPPLTYEEKEEATTHRVSYLPLCKCGYRSQLANPLTGLDYTLFSRYPIPLLVIPHKRCHFFVVLEVFILYTWNWITMCFVG
jgi:hypothetical protein